MFFNQSSGGGPGASYQKFFSILTKFAPKSAQMACLADLSGKTIFSPAFRNALKILAKKTFEKAKRGSDGLLDVGWGLACFFERVCPSSS